jgi:hypothetical protein
MATITKSSTADPTATHWSFGEVDILITDENPKLVTDDAQVIRVAKEESDFLVDESPPVVVAPVVPPIVVGKS